MRLWHRLSRSRPYTDRGEPDAHRSLPRPPAHAQHTIPDSSSTPHSTRHGENNPEEDDAADPFPSVEERNSTCRNSGSVPQLRISYTNVEHVDLERDVPHIVRRLQRRLQQRYLSQEISFGQSASTARRQSIDDIFTELLMVAHADLYSEFSDDAVSPRRSAVPKLGDTAIHVEHVLLRRAQLSHCIALADIVVHDHILDAACCASAHLCQYVLRRRSLRILLIGSAGCGKTTLFTHKAPYEWAQGREWKEFDLVVARELRLESVHGARNVAELFGLHELGVGGPNMQAPIVDFILDCSHRVCLVLDSLEETTLALCSDYVRAVINGDELQGICLILTSRPSRDVFSLAKTKPFDKIIELVGFQPNKVSEYIRKVLKEPAASNLLVAIDRDPQLAAIMATPFFAKATCELFEWSERMLPSCMADMFESMMLRIAERSSGKFYQRWHELPGEEQERILDVGQFAFTMLTRRKLVFKEAELDEHNLSKEAIELCLVGYDSTGFDAQRLWRFSHLTLQESLAAKYIAQRCCLDSGENVRWLVDKLKTLTGHLSTFWVLLSSQLKHHCVDTLISSILNEQARNSSHTTSCMTMQDDSTDQTAPGERHQQQLGHHVDDVHDFLFMDNARLLEIHEKLLDVLDRRAMEMLAGTLEVGVVTNTGRIAVSNQQQPQQQDREGTDSAYLKTLLFVWKRRVAQANCAMLHRAVRCVDSSLADKCALFLLPVIVSSARESGADEDFGVTSTGIPMPGITGDHGDGDGMAVASGNRTSWYEQSGYTGKGLPFLLSRSITRDGSCESDPAAVTPTCSATRSACASGETLRPDRVASNGSWDLCPDEVTGLFRETVLDGRPNIAPVPQPAHPQQQYQQSCILLAMRCFNEYAAAAHSPRNSTRNSRNHSTVLRTSSSSSITG
eukprot:scpid46283/ scgid14897/ Nucleotide-binding oligomerization domain-containing protein 2; Caspase recruitment domain-containing protein 15